ncbi:MAG: RsmG family class I SAM-dependent methyltransferase [Planctomycetota bacterium]
MDAEDALGVYLEAMLAENQHLNLTGIRDPAKARVLHVLDSLEIAGLVADLGLSPARALDLGSGNGFPGFALCALFADAEVWWMERTGKKVKAMQRILETPAVQATGVRPPNLLHMDAAQAPALRPDLRGHFDLVCARALGAPLQVAEWARPLTGAGGYLVLWLDHETGAKTKAKLPGFVRSGLRQYVLPEPAPRRRCLVCYRRS